MENPNTVQSNTPAPSEVQTPSTPAPTLEDIAREFPIEEQAQTFTAQPYTPPVQAPQVYVPDPITESEAYKSYQLAQYQQNQVLQNNLREVVGEVNQWKQQREQERLNADVDRAVAHVNAKLKVDPMLAEAALEVEYKRNPTFQRIWNNRSKNPQAFDKALEVLSNKLQPMFQVRQDPQLAENVRAAQSSQRTMATTQVKNDDWENLSEREFAQKWEQARRG